MPDATPFTADTLIADRMVIRWDWDGMPRFYLVRLFEAEPTSSGPMRKVHVELDGDPSVWHAMTTDDDADCLHDAAWDCIGQIEQIMASTWDREAAEELNDMRLSEERFYYR